MDISSCIFSERASNFTKEWSNKRSSHLEVLLNISSNSQENTFDRVIKEETLVKMFSSESCKSFKNTSFRGTPSVAASKTIKLTKKKSLHLFMLGFIQLMKTKIMGKIPC